MEQVAAAAEMDKMAVPVEEEELHMEMVELAATQELMAEAGAAQVTVVEEEEAAEAAMAEAAMAEAAAQAAAQRQAARAKRSIRIIYSLPAHWCP